MNLPVLLLAMFVFLMLVNAAAPQPALSCADLRHLMAGHTLKDVEAYARRLGVPETTIRDYIRSCHLG